MTRRNATITAPKTKAHPDRFAADDAATVADAADLQRHLHPPGVDYVRGTKGDGSTLGKYLPADRGRPTPVRPGAVVAELDEDGPGLVLRVSADGCRVVYPATGVVADLAWHEVWIDHVGPDPEFVASHAGHRPRSGCPRRCRPTLGSAGLPVPTAIPVGDDVYELRLRPGPLLTEDGGRTAARVDRDALTITVDDGLAPDALPFVAAWAVATAWRQLTVPPAAAMAGA